MATDNLILYSCPTSFSSQKVLLTLYMKNVDFELVNIDLESGKQYEPRYMELNPAGEVPTLKNGDVVKTDSDIMIDYINTEIKTDPNIIPGTNCKKGKEVDKWRQYLYHLKPELIRLGILLYPELSLREDELPIVIRQEQRTKCEDTISLLKTKAEENPKLADSYMKKIETLEKELNDYYSKTNVIKELDRLEEVFDFVEQQIKRAREACFATETDWNVFMFGREITVVDITIAVLLNLLCTVKVESRYIGKKKRRILYNYWENFKKNSSVKKLREQ